ncbi:DUF1194 domain-containing protein [Actibacterium sp. 188UL27-1]|uniref:DUF1194 domain-containing protein n=1 Tax=Actibacterium sp. 188UL27-1 TaxID=2786961 RepID=UPI00195826F7|nr:DUF1194 domain-containing protein [Actibacterium sp. 188UL27-1]MBM7066543.1 DUF1194 domain-containing protein [Actibacterium sp. 188UL27-1]
MRSFLLSTAAFAPGMALACDLALALAVDVSGSVSPEEYQIQMDGLAEGLRDGVVSEALVQAEAAVTVIQWTGSSRQVVSVPWTRVRDFDELEALAVTIGDTSRKWRNFSTAIGEALTFTHDTFAAVPDCKRRIIDVSGDGSSNEGIVPVDTHKVLMGADITVNALVIEGSEPDLTAYFWENVIVGPEAFVVTANGFEEYAERMREKLIRETAKSVSHYQMPDAPIIR